MVTLQTPYANNWQPEFVGTLLFLVRGKEVLLIHKKTGHGAGRINGPGGKLDAGETVIECACREVAEEVGLVVEHPTVGIEMRFVERNGPQWLGFALTATQFSGELRETREARPFWCPIDAVPYKQMWPDDAIWLPRLLAGEFSKPQVGNFLFDNEALLDHSFDSTTPSIWEAFGPSSRWEPKKER